jgi:hypothetical protein
LGFEKLNTTTEADKDKVLRRMLLMFIKEADEVVGNNFILVYVHTSLSILSQQPIIYKYYKMLPRSYKKNVQKLLVLHPTFLIRSFFEVGVRWFVKEKFYKKLTFVDSIVGVQNIIGATGTCLPASLIKYELADKEAKASGGKRASGDDDDNTNVVGKVALEELYDKDLGTTTLMHRCCQYMERNEALSMQGLFRISGDNDAIGVIRTIITTSADPEAMNTILFQGQGEAGGEDQDEWAYLTISDVHSAASALKVSLRMLPQPLVTFDAYGPLLEATKKHAGGDLDAWDRAVDLALVGMPLAHYNTLQYLLSFLARVALNIAETKMDASNLGKVFSPTVFRSPSAASGDATQLFGEVALAGKVLTRLITRKVEDEAAKAGGGTDDTSRLSTEEEIESRLSERVKGMAFTRGGR